MTGLVKNFNKYFSVKKYFINQNEFDYYSISDNYKLDDFCMEYYEKYKTNPYFINKWYAMDIFHNYFENENISEKSDALELGSGLGITALYISKKFKKVFCSENHFYSEYIIKKNCGLNNINNVYTIVSDWNSSPFFKKFKFIFGIDIIYDMDTVEPIIKILKFNLDINGIFYLANFDNYAFRTLVKEITKIFKIKDSFECYNCTQKIIVYKFEN